MTREVPKSNILIADDDGDDVLILRKALKLTGFDCDVASVKDGEELLAYLQSEGPFSDSRTHPRPDLILLDLNMPRRNGKEVLADIRSSPKLRAMPVVILTTSSAAHDIAECYELGANSFITKPMSFDGTIGAMKVITEYWFKTAKLPSSTPKWREAKKDD